MTAELSSKVISPDGTSIAFTRVGAGPALAWWMPPVAIAASATSF
jgi:hypothetical protein